MFPAETTKYLPLLTLITVGIIFTVNANTLYQNGWSTADTMNLFLMALGGSAVAAAQIFTRRA